MRFLWWGRARRQSRVQSLQHEIERVRREIEQDKREIEETKHIVDEAVRRTNESFIEVEKETRRAEVEVALIRDLSDGWKRHG